MSSSIHVDHVSKKFCRSLKHSMFYGAQDIIRESLQMPNHSRLRENEFWALDNISFKTRPGECLGIIGGNGSGKSTLLKLINGILLPDRGSITVNGRVSALIEVGAGFHPLLSGRENIYINGAIHGMKKKEINNKVDQIIEFSELGEFINSPVKHYSTGMYMRLGFSIAVHTDSNILLIDEAFAVGDTSFRLKCFHRIMELNANGTLVVLVTHNLSEMYRLCERAILLNKGQLTFFGTLQQTVSRYQELILKSKQLSTEESKEIKIIAANTMDSNGNQCKSFNRSSLISLEIEYESSISLNNSTVIIKVSSADLGPFVSFTNHVTNTIVPINKGRTSFRVNICRLNLLAGSYCFEVHIYDEIHLNHFCKAIPACCFCIKHPIPEVWGEFHSIRADHQWILPE